MREELYCFNKPLKVTISVVTLVAFFINIFCYDIAILRPLGFTGNAWAAGTPSALTGVGADRAGGPGLFKELNVSNFVLPIELGTIRDSWQPPSRADAKGVVIHIQDAHCNYACQQKITGIVEYLNNEYGLDLVNLEGGAGDYDLSVFTDMGDKGIREKVSGHFVRSGDVSGAEYFAVNNPDKIRLWGIEDRQGYIDNLNAYRGSLAHKSEVDRILKSIDNMLTNLKAKIYSSELLELDSKYSQYKSGAIEFREYVKYLAAKAKDRSIDMTSLRNARLLSMVIVSEQDIDFKKANDEREGAIDALHKTLSRSALEELVVKTVEFKEEKASRRDFYAFLVKKMNAAGIDIGRYPDLGKYIVYVNLYDEIDKVLAVEEMGLLEDKIRLAVFRNDKERKLSELSKNLAVLNNIFNISLTKADYDHYMKDRRSFESANFIDFVDREKTLYGITARLDDAVGDLDRYCAQMMKFYGYSLKRDEAFVRNIKLDSPSRPADPSSAPGVKSAIVITGGFHAENLANLFKKNNIAYISVMPNFKNPEGYSSPYFKLLSGRLDPIEDKIRDAFSSTIAVASVLNELGTVASRDRGLYFKIHAELVRAGFENKNGVIVRHGDKLRAINRDGTVEDAASWNDARKRDYIVMPYLTELSPALQLGPVRQSAPAPEISTPLSAKPAGVLEKLGMGISRSLLAASSSGVAPAAVLGSEVALSVPPAKPSAEIRTVSPAVNKAAESEEDIRSLTQMLLGLKDGDPEELASRVSPKQFYEYLVKNLKNPDGSLNMDMVLVIAAVEDKRAIDGLMEAIGSPDFAKDIHRGSIIKMVSDTGDERAFAASVRLLEDSDRYVRMDAYVSLGHYAGLAKFSERAAAQLLEGLKKHKDDTMIVGTIIDSFYSLKDPGLKARFIEPFKEIMRSGDKDLKRQAIFALCAIKDEGVVLPLVDVIADEKDNELTIAAIAALSGIRNPIIDPVLIDFFAGILATEKNPHILAFAEEGLVNIGAPALEKVKELSNDKEIFPRAIGILMRLGYKPAVDALVGSALDKNGIASLKIMSSGQNNRSLGFVIDSLERGLAAAKSLPEKDEADIAARTKMIKLLKDARDLNIMLPLRWVMEYPDTSLLEEIVKNRKNTSYDNRPVVAVVYAHADSTGALTERNGYDAIKALVKEGYRVMYYEASSVEGDGGLIASLKAAAAVTRDKEGLDAVYFSGHSAPGNMSLGGHNPEVVDPKRIDSDLVLKAEDFAKLDRTILKRGGTFIFMGCRIAAADAKFIKAARERFPHAGNIFGLKIKGNIKKLEVGIKDEATGVRPIVPECVPPGPDTMYQGSIEIKGLMRTFAMAESSRPGAAIPTASVLGKKRALTVAWWLEELGRYAAYASGGIWLAVFNIVFVLSHYLNLKEYVADYKASHQGRAPPLALRLVMPVLFPAIITSVSLAAFANLPPAMATAINMILHLGLNIYAIKNNLPSAAVSVTGSPESNESLLKTLKLKGIPNYRPGDSASKVKLEGSIGTGAESEVLRGSISGVYAPVAVKATKLPRHSMFTDRETRQRSVKDAIRYFEKETRILKELSSATPRFYNAAFALEHRAITPRYYGRVDLGDIPAFAMEMVKGVSSVHGKPQDILDAINSRTRPSVEALLRSIFARGYIPEDFQFIILTEDQTVNGEPFLAGEVVLIDVSRFNEAGFKDDSVDAIERYINAMVQEQLDDFDGLVARLQNMSSFIGAYNSLAPKARIDSVILDRYTDNRIVHFRDGRADGLINVNVFEKIFQHYVQTGRIADIDYAIEKNKTPVLEVLADLIPRWVVGRYPALRAIYYGWRDTRMKRTAAEAISRSVSPARGKFAAVSFENVVPDAVVARPLADLESITVSTESEAAGAVSIFKMQGNIVIEYGVGTSDGYKRIQGYDVTPAEFNGSSDTYRMGEWLEITFKKGDVYIKNIRPRANVRVETKRLLSGESIAVAKEEPFANGISASDWNRGLHPPEYALISDDMIEEMHGLGIYARNANILGLERQALYNSLRVKVSREGLNREELAALVRLSQDMTEGMDREHAAMVEYPELDISNPDIIGPHGMIVDKVASRGRAAAREIIIVDWEKDKALNELYEKILAQARIGDQDRLDGETKRDLLERLFKAIKTIAYNKDAFAKEEKMNKPILIGQAYLRNGGVCRHMGILASAILFRMANEGLLNGDVYYIRSSDHGFAVYVPAIMAGEAARDRLRVFDAAQQEGIVKSSALVYSSGVRHPYSEYIPDNLYQTRAPFQYDEGDDVYPTFLPTNTGGVDGLLDRARDEMASESESPKPPASVLGKKRALTVAWWLEELGRYAAYASGSIWLAVFNIVFVLSHYLNLKEYIADYKASHQGRAPPLALRLVMPVLFPAIITSVSLAAFANLPPAMATAINMILHLGLNIYAIKNNLPSAAIPVSDEKTAAQPSFAETMIDLNRGIAELETALGQKDQVDLRNIVARVKGLAARYGVELGFLPHLERVLFIRNYLFENRISLEDLYSTEYGKGVISDYEANRKSFAEKFPKAQDDINRALVSHRARRLAERFEANKDLIASIFASNLEISHKYEIALVLLGLKPVFWSNPDGWRAVKPEVDRAFSIRPGGVKGIDISFGGENARHLLVYDVEAVKEVIASQREYSQYVPSVPASDAEWGRMIDRALGERFDEGPDVTFGKLLGSPTDESGDIFLDIGVKTADGRQEHCHRIETLTKKEAVARMDEISAALPLIDRAIGPGVRNSYFAKIIKYDPKSRIETVIDRISLTVPDQAEEAPYGQPQNIDTINRNLADLEKIYPDIRSHLAELNRRPGGASLLFIGPGLGFAILDINREYPNIRVESVGKENFFNRAELGQYQGVDLAQARNRLNGGFALGQVEDVLPAKISAGQRYDAVVVGNAVVDYIPDRVALVRNIHGVLSPGGIGLVELPPSVIERSEADAESKARYFAVQTPQDLARDVQRAKEALEQNPQIKVTIVDEVSLSLTIRRDNPARLDPALKQVASVGRIDFYAAIPVSVPARTLEPQGRLKYVSNTRSNVWLFRDEAGNRWWVKIDSDDGHEIMWLQELSYKLADATGANVPVHRLYAADDILPRLDTGEFKLVAEAIRSYGKPVMVIRDVGEMAEADLATRASSGAEELLAFYLWANATDVVWNKDFRADQLGGITRYMAFDLNVNPIHSADEASDIRHITNYLFNMRNELDFERFNSAIERIEGLSDEELAEMATSSGIDKDDPIARRFIAGLVSNRDNIRRIATRALSRALTYNPTRYKGNVEEAKAQLVAKINDMNAALYIRGISNSMKAAFGKTNQSVEPKFVFIPISKALCGDSAVIMQNVMQNLWAIERGRLERGYGIADTNVIFYDGTIAQLKEKIALASSAGNLKPSNTVVFMDGNTNSVRDVPADLKASGYSLLWDKSDDPAGGYLSIGGHVGLALLVMDLRRRAANIADRNEYDEYFKLVRAHAAALGVDPADLAGITNAEELIKHLQDGRLIIRLPRIAKIAIDENMRKFVTAEEAAMKSL